MQAKQRISKTNFKLAITNTEGFNLTNKTNGISAMSAAQLHLAWCFSYRSKFEFLL